MLEKTGVYVLRILALHLGLDEFYLIIMPKRKFYLTTNSLSPITSEPENAIPCRSPW
jgi:hypothetical protein